MVASCHTVEGAMSLAKRLVETVNTPCDLDGVAYAPSITIGGVLSPDSAGDPRQLMLLADEALYQTKAAGRNCWGFSSSLGEADRFSTIWRADAPEGVAETVYVD